MPKKSTTETTARESPTRNENLKIAHDLAKLDLPIFPCKPDKSPHTKTGFKAATTDKKQIDRWWDKHPDALPGLRCASSRGSSHPWSRASCRIVAPVAFDVPLG
jgi:hypothetical protein